MTNSLSHTKLVSFVYITSLVAVMLTLEGCGQKAALYIDRDYLARQEAEEKEEERKEAEEKAVEEEQEKTEENQERDTRRDLPVGPDIEYIDGLPVYR